MRLLAVQDGWVIGTCQGITKGYGGALLADFFFLVPEVVGAITGPEQATFSLVDLEHRPVYTACFVSSYETKAPCEGGEYSLEIVKNARITWTGHHDTGTA